MTANIGALYFKKGARERNGKFEIGDFVIVTPYREHDSHFQVRVLGKIIGKEGNSGVQMNALPNSNPSDFENYFIKIPGDKQSITFNVSDIEPLNADNINQLRMGFLWSLKALRKKFGTQKCVFCPTGYRIQLALS